MTWVAAGFAVFQVVNGAQQAELVRDQGRLTKEIADMNAEFAEVDAWNAEKQGDTNVARYEGQVEQTLSAQRTAFAAKDVDITYGSAAEVVKDTKLAGFLNVLDIKNQAHNQALGYKNQARQFTMAGITGESQSAINAGGIKSASIMNAGSTALSGYSKSKGKSSSSTSESSGE